MKKFITNLLASLLIISGVLFAGCTQDPGNDPTTPTTPPTTPSATLPAKVVSIEFEKTYKAEYDLTMESQTEHMEDYFKFHEDGSVSFYNFSRYLTDDTGTYLNEGHTWVWYNTFFGGMGEVPGVMVYTLTETVEGVVCDIKLGFSGEEFHVSDIELEAVEDVAVQEGIYSLKYDASGSVCEESSVMAILNGRAYGADDTLDIVEVVGPYILLRDVYDHITYINAKAKVAGDTTEYLFIEDAGYILYECAIDEQTLGFKSSHSLISKMFTKTMSGTGATTMVAESTQQALTLFSTGDGIIKKGSGTALYVDEANKEWRGDWVILGGRVIVVVQETDGEIIQQFELKMIDGGELTELSFFNYSYTKRYGSTSLITKISAWGTASKAHFDGQITE